MIRVDASVEEACAYARIHYNTFYNRFSDDTEFLWEYMTTDPADPSGNSKIVVEEYCTFRELVEQARAYKYILAKKKVFEAISNGDSKMAMEFLRRRNKDYYDKQVNFEKDNSNLVDEVLSELA